MESTDRAQPSLDVRLLGPIQLFADDRPVDLGGPMVSALLARLVMSRGKPVAQVHLIEALWGDGEAGSANNVHGYISSLRKVLGHTGVDAKALLRTVRGGCYQLDLDDTQCDLGRFQLSRAAADLASRDGDSAAAADHCTTALREFSGDPLANLREFQFATNFAVVMTEERRAVQVDRIVADMACGRDAAVVADLTMLTADHPRDEHIWRLFITALYRTGRQADALDACLRLRATLRRERGVDPEPKTVALENAVRRQQVVETGHAPEPLATTREVPGVHRQSWLRGPAGVPIPIPAEGLAIGRDQGNDVVIDDNRVSRKHARILHHDESVFIRDRDSANGVYVNEVRIVADTALCDGDRIRLGSTTLRFSMRDD